MRPIYETAVCLALGWARSSSIPHGPRRGAAAPAIVKFLRCDHGPLRDETRGEIAPQGTISFRASADDRDGV